MEEVPNLDPMPFAFDGDDDDCWKNGCIIRDRLGGGGGGAEFRMWPGRHGVAMLQCKVMSIRRMYILSFVHIK